VPKDPYLSKNNRKADASADHRHNNLSLGFSKAILNRFFFLVRTDS
jgi:hypothetical protein